MLQVASPYEQFYSYSPKLPPLLLIMPPIVPLLLIMPLQINYMTPIDPPPLNLDTRSLLQDHHLGISSQDDN